MGPQQEAVGLTEKVTAAHLKGNLDVESDPERLPGTFQPDSQSVGGGLSLPHSCCLVYHSRVRNSNCMNAFPLESVLSKLFGVVSFSRLSSKAHRLQLWGMLIFSIICITVQMLFLQSTDFFPTESAC